MATDDPVMTAVCKVCGGAAHVCELPDSKCRFKVAAHIYFAERPGVLRIGADSAERNERARSLAKMLRATEDAAMERLSEARTRAIDRLITIVDEACGLQPVQSTEETLTVLERHLFECRRRLTALERVAAAGRMDHGVRHQGLDCDLCNELRALDALETP